MEKFIEVKVRVLGQQNKDEQLRLVSLEISPINKPLPEITEENINEEKICEGIPEGVKINLANEFDVPNSNEYRLVFGFRVELDNT